MAWLVTVAAGVAIWQLGLVETARLVACLLFVCTLLNRFARRE